MDDLCPLAGGESDLALDVAQFQLRLHPGAHLLIVHVDELARPEVVRCAAVLGGGHVGPSRSIGAVGGGHHVDRECEGQLARAQPLAHFLGQAAI
eukprot:scaffold28499_cov35-Tisochrysis_lutea.AAC.3